MTTVCAGACDDGRGPDALDLVDVDSDRNAVLRPDGTIALLDARFKTIEQGRLTPMAHVRILYCPV
ncbi:MAG TPA: hypothetical protein VGP69_00890 [Gaiellaceae bacterium]|nr:hypothetical protein [Gaiellaceae bacterium]